MKRMVLTVLILIFLFGGAAYPVALGLKVPGGLIVLGAATIESQLFTPSGILANGGTVEADFFIGNGSALSNITANYTPLSGTASMAAGLNIPGQVQGDILYFNGTNWASLTAGTSGYFLKTQGASQNPIWASGEAGPQGPTGEAGPQGIQGIQGMQGPIGLTGETGAVGPQGPIGLTGEAGPQGIQGPIGLTGEAGPQGIQGPIGATGETGAIGPQGPIGLTGEAGPQGIQGPIGATGETGAIGPQGPIGLTGEAGPQGIQGLIGPTGEAATNKYDNVTVDLNGNGSLEVKIPVYLIHKYPVLTGSKLIPQQIKYRAVPLHPISTSTHLVL